MYVPLISVFVFSVFFCTAEIIMKGEHSMYDKKIELYLHNVKECVLIR